MGRKIGLNGIDNAKISFDQVRVPRTNLLNAYSEVEKDGSYSTVIEGNISIQLDKRVSFSYASK